MVARHQRDESCSLGVRSLTRDCALTLYKLMSDVIPVASDGALSFPPLFRRPGLGICPLLLAVLVFPSLLRMPLLYYLFFTTCCTAILRAQCGAAVLDFPSLLRTTSYAPSLLSLFTTSCTACLRAECGAWFARSGLDTLAYSSA